MLFKQDKPERILFSAETALSTMQLSDREKERFLEKARKAVEVYGAAEDTQRELSYVLRKRMGQLELKLFFPGERNDPFSESVETPEDRLEAFVSKLPLNRSTTVGHLYLAGENVLSIRTPKQYRDTALLKNPMVIAMLLGLLCGLLCRQLPENVCGFLVNQIASPLFSVYTKMIGGIMGPILFLSLIVSIAAMESIDRLNTAGRKMMMRYVCITLFLMAITGAISLAFFHQFREGSVALNADNLTDMLWSVVPTSLFTPFVENNFAQIMVIAFGVGTALLLLGDRAKGLTERLDDIRQCLFALWGFVNKLLPLIPFIGLFTIAVGNRLGVLLSAWKYLVATVLCFIAAALIKWMKVSLKLRIDPLLLIRKMKPVLVGAFCTASFPAVMEIRRKVAVEDCGIDPTFSDFWVSIAYSLYKTSTPVYLIASVLFITELSGVSVSLAFFAMLAFLTFQFSLASPGMTATWTVTFETLGIGTDNVGLFTACKLFTNNLATACAVFYSDLEQLEAAYTDHAIDMDHLRTTEE